jgi:tetratricopeptide (TPR) repeat protein
VTDISSRKILGQNQLTYQRLKVALSLGLRRQIFVAVCDDLQLRDRLAAQLQAELAKSKGESRRYPRLVSLNLDLNDPHPIVQVAHWLQQNPPPTSGRRTVTMPAFQMLGVEHLTRQSAATQRLFFTHLQSIEQSLPMLESSLLIWITQPWFRALPQSAPEFWRCRTGIFEFVGDPTPLPTSGTWEIGTNIRLHDLPNPLEPDARLSDSGSRSGGGFDRGNGPTGEAHSGGSYGDDDRWRRSTVGGNLGDRLEDDLKETAVAVAASALQDRVSSVSASSSSSVSTALSSTASIITKPSAAPIPTAQNLERLPLPQQIELLQQQNASPEILADAYRSLGNLYRDRIEQGEATADNITIAIQSYEKGLPLLSENSLLWVDMLNDLGSLYWMLSRTSTPYEASLHNLKKGILAYQLALTKIDLATQVHLYPLIQNNLGAAYADLARHQDPAANLQLAIQSYQESLQYRDVEADSRRYASTQNNLGTTFWNLAQHLEPEKNLKEAIAAYSEALCHYAPDEEPFNYAMIQNNLGTAYWNLAQRERPQDWLALAIASYKIALQYRTLANAPAAFAATQNNLGTAYWHLASHADTPTQKLEWLQQAIEAYEATLKAANLLARQQSDPAQPTSLSFDLFATYNNLGLAYYQIATDSQSRLDQATQSTYLEAAMRHHVQAYQGWSQRAELQSTAFSCMVQTCRAFYNQLGMAGQNLALSLIPGPLLSEVLPKL